MENQIGQFLFAISIDYIRRRRRVSLIEPHVQRPFVGKRKASFRIVQLETGQSQVRDGSAHLVPTHSREMVLDIRKRARAPFAALAEPLQALGRLLQSLLIAIQTKHLSVGRRPLKNRFCMSSASNGCVQVSLPR
jgi:hypothetical protein